MRKIFTFLLALAASVGMMNAKVTWNSSNISDFRIMGTFDSYLKDGVTLRGNAEMVDARWQGYGDESRSGIGFNTNETGGFTFSNTLGKNFTKIQMTLTGPGDWDRANLGSGWSFYWNPIEEKPATVTWTGNAATVDLLKEASSFHGDYVKSIVFYFEGDSEAPDPTYTVALKDGTANADKVTLSATSVVEGATITVTPNEEYEIKDFSATYNTTEKLSTSFDPATGAYSFKMPAYDVTIEATIALKPVPEGDIFAGFTATAGSGGFNNEGHANLVDNKFTSADWTKWCADNSYKSVPTGETGDACWWLDFEASAALNLTGYILTTGNDTGNEHGRNPKNWVLKAKLNADDAWTTIATVTDDVTMKNQSFKDYKFFVDQSGPYQYFRFEMFANQGANVMQLCELRLIGTEAPAPAPTPTTTDLASITDNYTAQDGEILTGTLGVNVKISIADGATVTLLNANINGDKTWTTGEYAGLTCLGDATITIVGKNSVSGFYADDLGNAFPGIYVPSGKTLIINGTGSLTAQSSVGNAAGIGARKDMHCGNIEIQSGKITAIACGERGAGIGGAYNANCGNITISGGIVTAVGGKQSPGIGGGRRGASTNAGHCGNILINGGVVSATSGADAAAIGGGRGNNNSYKTNCGTITITNTALKVYADQGGGSTNTIGAGKYGNCGAVTIGDKTGVINNDPYTYRTKEDGEIVVDYINAIGTVVYTQECKDKIDIARELYDALEDSQKTLVTNYQVLLDAEAAYAALIPQPTPTTYTLQLHVNDAAMGSLALQNPSSDIVDNGDGTYTVPEGATVTLQATPNEGYEFIGWKASQTICDFADCEFVDVKTVNNPLTFDMYADGAFMAEFKASAPAPATTTVTWNSTDFTEEGTYTSHKGIEVNPGVEVIDIAMEVPDVTISGPGSFSTTNSNLVFTKIEVSGGEYDEQSFEGEGWSDSEGKRVWEGQAATVPFNLGTIYSGDEGNVPWTIVFTLAPAAPQPTPTVYNSGSVALSNLKVGDILMAGVTVTSEKADYKITLAANRLKFMNSVRSSDLTTQFSSINPVLGENAVILTSTPAMFYTPIDEDGNTGNAWEVTANEVGTKVTLAGITYSGTEPDPATPTVWTALKVGDVIKVGDQLSPSVELASANDYGVFNPEWAPYTLLRANIAQDEYDEPVVTEAEDGAYYVFKFTHPSAGTYYFLAHPEKCTLLAATATSDGLEVTNVGDYYGTPLFTFAVHDNGGTPTAVENVQTNQVQGTKILRDGMLLIEKNGKIYNAQGAEVK